MAPSANHPSRAAAVDRGSRRAGRRAHDSSVTAATASSGRLLDLTRQVAATARPVNIALPASRTLGARKSVNPTNANPKHNGESTSLWMP